MAGGLSKVDAARVARRMDKLSREFDGRGMAADLNKLGQAAKEDVAVAVSGTLGDLSMSHWRRGRPIQITGRYDVDGTTVEVSPMSRARGPMRVLEDGRRARDAQSKVSFRRLKSGAVKVRHGKTTARSGATKGKNTWSKAEALMTVGTIKRMQTASHQKWVRALRG